MCGLGMGWALGKCDFKNVPVPGHEEVRINTACGLHRNRCSAGKDSALQEMIGVKAQQTERVN